MNTIIIIIINNKKYLGKITTNLQPEEKKDGHKSQGEQQPSERTVSRLRCWRVQRYREAGSGVSGNDIWEFGNGKGIEKNPFPQFGNGKGMKKTIPKIQEWEGNEEIHSQNWGKGSE